MTYHAKASSAIFAIHVMRGLTTPGLKNVPMPGCEKGQLRCSGWHDRRHDRDGSKSLVQKRT